MKRLKNLTSLLKRCWFFKGPNDDPECMNVLNRHGFLTDLLEAYLGTGNRIYPRYVDRLVADWVAQAKTMDPIIEY